MLPCFLAVHWRCYSIVQSNEHLGSEWMISIQFPWFYPPKKTEECYAELSLPLSLSLYQNLQSDTVKRLTWMFALLEYQPSSCFPFECREEKISRSTGSPRPPWSSGPSGATRHPRDPRHSREQCCGASRTTWTPRPSGAPGPSGSSRYISWLVRMSTYYMARYRHIYCIKRRYLRTSVGWGKRRNLVLQPVKHLRRTILHCESFPTLQERSSCQNQWTHCLHTKRFWCRMSNIVWESSDPFLNYVTVCFVLTIIHPLFLCSVFGQGLIISLSCLLGVADKSKTREFQVQCVIS